MSQLNIFDFLDTDQREDWTDYFSVKRLLERNGFMSEIMARTKDYNNHRYTPNSVYYYVHLAEGLIIRCIITDCDSRNKITDIRDWNVESIAAIMPVRY